MSEVHLVEIQAVSTRDVTARLWLDDRDGRVIVMHDGEVWMHCWPRENRGGGASLDAWLAGCNLSYVAKKMRANRWFDLEATVLAAKRLTLEVRHTHDLTHGEARDLYGDVVEIRDRASAEHWFEGFLRADPHAWESSPLRYGVEPEFGEAFAALWPKLKEFVDGVSVPAQGR